MSLIDEPVAVAYTKINNLFNRMDHTLSLGSVFSSAWKKTTPKLGFLIVLTLVVGVVLGTPDAVAALAEENHPGLALLFNLIGWVMTLWLTPGLFIILLKIYAGEPVTVSELFKHSNLLFKYFWVGAVVGVIVMFGLALLIVPGIILALMFQFAPWYVVDQRLGTVEAMTQSMKATKGVKGNLFLISLALVGVNILGAIPLGLGLLVTIPLTWMVMVTSYKLVEARV